MMRRLERQLCEVLRKQLSGQKTRTPEVGRDLMIVFSRLSEARSWHRFGPNPITFPDIESFCRLMRIPLSPAHVAIIRALDAIWVEDFHSKHSGEADGMKTLPKVSDHPLTAALFDVTAG